MPRIRTIKPEFWSSPGIQHLSPWARLLYIAMWNWADDSGRGTCNLRELQAFAFPLDEESEVVGTSDGFRRTLAEVRDTFGVVFYTVDGRPYYEIPSWSKHQRRERNAQSRYPGPDEGESWDFNPVTCEAKEVPSQAKETPDNVTELARTSGPGTGEQGNRGTPCSPPRGDATPTRKPRREPERFAEFYDLYPKHKGRDAAARAFAKVIERGVDAQDLVNGAKRYRVEVTGKDPKYVKHPATWLNQGCWQDEPDLTAPNEDWRRYCEQ